MYLLINGLYKINTEYIKLVLDIEQFATVVIDHPYPQCTENILFSTHSQ